MKNRITTSTLALFASLILMVGCERENASPNDHVNRVALIINDTDADVNIEYRELIGEVGVDITKPRSGTIFY